MRFTNRRVYCDRMATIDELEDELRALVQRCEVLGEQQRTVVEEVLVDELDREYQEAVARVRACRRELSQQRTAAAVDFRSSRRCKLTIGRSWRG